MTPTLLKTSLRYLLKRPWQVGLAVLGVALGVAVMVSIDLANASARRAFTLSAETVAGRTTQEIVGGPGGLDEAIYRRLRVDLGVRSSAPLVEGYAAAPDHPGLTLHILGIDPLAEAPFRPYLAPAGASPAGQLSALLTVPGAALLPADTARAYGLRPGDQLRLRVGSRMVQATIAGLLEPEDSASRSALDGLLIADIASAQEWLGSVGRLTRIDLILPEGDAGQAMVDRIATILPAGVHLDSPAQRSVAIQQMTAAFELNLTALSLLALIVGMFLIYNTVTFSVVQRRGLIGTLRCLGVTRGQIFALILAEALLVGLVGALLGVVLGIALGRGLIGLVTRTINDLYFTVTVREVAIGAGPLVKGFTLGLAATLMAAMAPAVEATFTPPRTVLRRSSYEERVRRVVPLAAVGGALLLALGGALLAIPSKNLVLSFVALFGITIGAAALTPLATLLLMWAARPVMGALFGLLGRMAVRDVVASLSRTSVAVAALMIAVSVTIGVGLMVGSFRYTVVRWLDSSLSSDIYVSAPGLASNRPSTPLPPALIERLSTAPGVARVRRYRSVTVDSPAGPTALVAQEIGAQDRSALQIAAGDPDAIWAGFARGEALISEPLAYRRGLQPGDSFTLLTDRGERAFRVAGVYYDYGSDQGIVLLDLATYQAYWDDRAISSLGVYAAPGQDVDALVQELRDIAAGTTTDDRRPTTDEDRRPETGASPTIAPRTMDDGQTVHEPPLLNIRSNRALHDSSLAVFDRTFAITTVLRLLATIVAFVGVLAALMALQLERARELGMLRANGLTPGQLWGVVISQTGLMGLTAGLLALPVGVALATVLVYVINKRSFGWTLLFRLDAGLFVQALLVAVAAALLAGLYPAWRMSRTSPALALREE
jgi:putative ABC transport system permease protein